MLSNLILQRAVLSPRISWINSFRRFRTISSRDSLSSNTAAARILLSRRYLSSPPVTSPSSTPSTASTSTTSTTLFGKGVALIKEYGAVGLGVYFTLWAVPFASSFILFDLNNNFGQDPVVWVEYFAGKDNRIKLWASLGMKPDDNLSPRVISLLLAYLVCEVIETPRIAATVFLTPVAKRYLVSSSASSSAAKAASVLSLSTPSETNSHESNIQRVGKESASASATTLISDKR
jgi:hypothetical protein